MANHFKGNLYRLKSIKKSGFDIIILKCSLLYDSCKNAYASHLLPLVTSVVN